MKKAINRTLPIGLALLLVLLLLPWSVLRVQGAEMTTVGITVNYGQTEARAMLEYINKFRAGEDVDGQRADYWQEYGGTKTDMTGQLSPLTYDYDLERVAMQRAAEIAMSFDHTRPDGSSCFSAWSDNWYGRGENIAAGRTTAKATFVDWREDNEDYAGQGHRRNMLYSGYTRIGIGHVVYNGIHYWSQAFGWGSGDDTDPGVVNGERQVSVDVNADSVVDINVAASPESYALKVGEGGALPSVSASILLIEAWPENRMVETEVNPAWASSDNAIAKIENGKVTGVAAGSATLTADVLGETLTVSVTVTEEQPDDPGFPIQSIEVTDGIVFEGVSCDTGIHFNVLYKDGTEQPVYTYNSLRTKDDSFYTITKHLPDSSGWKAGEVLEGQMTISESAGIGQDRFSATYQYPVQVYKINSIGIKDDGELNVTVQTTDGNRIVGSAQAFIADVNFEGKTLNEKTGWLYTDKFNVRATIRHDAVADVYSIVIGEGESNPIASDWLKAAGNVPGQITMLCRGSQNLRWQFSFNGRVTEENIDDIILGTYCYRWIFGLPLEYTEVKQGFQVYETEVIDSYIRELFAVEGDIDFTKFSYYNPETGKVEIQYNGIGGGGYMPTITAAQKETSVQWIGTDDVDQTIRFDDNYKITRIIRADEPEPEFIKGDVNGDKAVDAKDLTTLAKHVAKIALITDAGLLKAADVNGDGAVDAKDLTHLAKYVAKIIPEL